MVKIPCGFIDFFLKFPILSMFQKRTKMTIEKLPKLISYDKINSSIQIVCNYLIYLKEGKLANKDIIIKGVSFSAKDLCAIINENYVPEKTILNVESLSSVEWFNLIKKYIGIPLPSYYQINSFVDVLAGQLRNFSMNIQMIAAYLIPYENMLVQLKGSNLKNLRVTMVESFFKNTILFTQGAFETLLTSQENTYKISIKNWKYNANAQNEIAVEALLAQDQKGI